MTRRLKVALSAVLLTPVLTFAQAPQADTALAEARRALGGDALARLQSLVIQGKVARPTPSGTTEREFEMHMQLPDKFMRREVLAALGNMSVYRRSGFNGPDGLINETDQPPQLGGSAGGELGARIVIRSGAMPAGGATPTPEQLAEQRRTMLLNTKKEYARLTLGMFMAAPAVYPLAFAYAGEAESPDGAAHVIDVKGEADFEVRLFLDTKTRLPLMLSWMDKEPLAPMTVQQVISTGARPSPEEMQKQMAERQAQMQAAEAARRTVEYRLFYGDFKSVSGMLIPHSFQRMADGKIIEEMTFDRVRVNQRIDDDTFKVSK